MRLLLIFIIFILGGFYTFGNDNCCEQCCEYLKNCCNKGKVQEEAKDLVNENWLNKKKQNINFILNIFNKNENENENEYKSGDITIKLVKEDKDKTKIANLKDMKEKLKTNTQKWALFKIIYKKEGNKEEETKYLYCSDIGSINGYGIFYHCQQHVSISVIACDTSEVTDMSDMFYDCSSLTKLNLSKFDTKKVTDMTLMFWGCTSLTELNLSNFNTETVTCMCAMFCGCAYLQQLDLTNFNTENVTDMGSMFSSCKKLKNLDLSKFDTKNVTDMSSMFYRIPIENLKSFTLPKSLSNFINN